MEYFLKTAKVTGIVPRLYTKEEVNLFIQDSSKKNLVILETSWKYLNSEELESLFMRSNFDRKDQLFYGMRVVTIRKK